MSLHQQHPELHQRLALAVAELHALEDERRGYDAARKALEADEAVNHSQRITVLAELVCALSTALEDTDPASAALLSRAWRAS